MISFLHFLILLSLLLCIILPLFFLTAVSATAELCWSPESLALGIRTPQFTPCPASFLQDNPEQVTHSAELPLSHLQTETMEVTTSEKDYTWLINPGFSQPLLLLHPPGGEPDGLCLVRSTKLSFEMLDFEASHPSLSSFTAVICKNVFKNP